MENSYNLFLDERYAGKMAFFDSADAFAQVCGLILGVHPFTMDEKEIAEAADIMRRIHANLRFYWTDPTQIEQALAAGEIVLSYSWKRLRQEPEVPGAGCRLHGSQGRDPHMGVRPRAWATVIPETSISPTISSMPGPRRRPART